MSLEQYENVELSELKRIAVEDFAVVFPANANKAKVVKEMEEVGVTFDLFAQAHPAYKPVVETPVVVESGEPVLANVGVDERIQEAQRSGAAITSQTIKEAPTVAVAQPQVRTAVPLVPSQTDSYLVKMDRKNPYFEFGNYKFTKDNPFNVMDAESTSLIMRKEVGFHIATPDEAAEFYS